MALHKILHEDFEFISRSSLEFEKLSDKNILITGASGFLASYLTQSLLFLNKKFNLNLHIYALVRNVDVALKKYQALLPDQSLSFIQQDVCDPLHLEKPLHYIIHTASKASPIHYKTDPVGTLKANTLGTISLLDYARTQPIENFLFFSSGEVYGQVPADKIPILETSYGYIDINDVRSCYAESKRIGENACVSYFHQYQIPTTIVRPFHTYGPMMSLDDGRIFSDFVRNLVENKNLEIKSDGMAQRPYCYVADATLGFLTILLNGQYGQAYNLGNPSMEVSVNTLAEMLISLFPEKKLGIQRIQRDPNDKYLPSPIARNSPNIEKLAKLGWKPYFDINSGFQRTVESFL